MSSSDVWDAILLCKMFLLSESLNELKTCAIIFPQCVHGLAARGVDQPYWILDL